MSERLCEMTDDERCDFLTLLSRVTELNLPDGVNFVVVLLDEPHENVHFVSNLKHSDEGNATLIINMLRHAAATVERIAPPPGTTLMPSTN